MAERDEFVRLFSSEIRSVFGGLPKDLRVFRKFALGRESPCW